tara:strand:- start:18240 stop:18728 length:489 start_codon:yes stop_codon:yes gene_type:complete
MISIVSESQGIKSQIELLLNSSFGEKRKTLPSQKFRKGSKPIQNLSFIAMKEELVVGVIRFTKISIGNEFTCLLLGPIAVLPEYQGIKIGSSLMKHGLKAAKNAGYELVVAIGDPEFLGDFGFISIEGKELTFPIFVDKNRFLIKELIEGSSKLAKGKIKLA